MIDAATHEVFDLTMPEVAEALGRSDVACRQLLHRARERLADRRPRRGRPSRAQSESAVVALVAALSAGDFEALQSLLLDGARTVTDHGGKARAARRTVAGAARVARFLIGLTAKHARVGGDARLAWVNGAPAVLALEGGRVTSVIVPDLVGDDDAGVRVADLYVVRNPDKLARVDRALREGTLRDVSLAG